jgi:vacuolar-type H+-ATPase subunit I/STV1
MRRWAARLRRARAMPAGGVLAMHIAIVTGIGLVVLAVFFFLSSLMGKGGPSGAYVFIWVWLVVSILNGAYGVMRAGIPLINELGAFIPIFGIPVLIAWYLAFKYGAAR